MKICVTAIKNDLNALLDPRFGRAAYFLIVDEEGELIKTIKNIGTQAIRGAGIAAAQIMVKEKINVVITGGVGPNAFMVLNDVGIKIFLGSPTMNIREAIQEYQNGKLQEVTEAMSPAGFGIRFNQRRRRRRSFRGRG